MGDISQRNKTCDALELPRDYQPPTSIRALFDKITLQEIIGCLRASTDETAMVLCALWDRLNAPQKKNVDIDLLISAAHCKDPHHVASLISEQYSKIKAIETMMIAANESPGIMRKVTKFSKERKGFQHARMVLQTSGVAPVPKNQTNYIFGNKIDQSKNNQINVASHKEAVDQVSEILAQLPRVSSQDHIVESPGDRESQEDRTD